MHGGAVEDFLGLPVARVLTPRLRRAAGRAGRQIDEPGFLAYESEHVRTRRQHVPGGGRDDGGARRPRRAALWLTWVDDLTERRRAESDAARHADELARSNADLDRFAGVVSHDLQSPMRVIAGCARVLERRAGEHLARRGARARRAHRRRRAPDDRAARRDPRVLAACAATTRRCARSTPGAVVDGVLASLAADLEAAGAPSRVGDLPAAARAPGRAGAAVPEPDRQRA